MINTFLIITKSILNVFGSYIDYLVYNVLFLMYNDARLSNDTLNNFYIDKIVSKLKFFTSTRNNIIKNKIMMNLIVWISGIIGINNIIELSFNIVRYIQCISLFMNTKFQSN